MGVQSEVWVGIVVVRFELDRKRNPEPFGVMGSTVVVSGRRAEVRPAPGSTSLLMVVDPQVSRSGRALRAATTVLRATTAAMMSSGSPSGPSKTSGRRSNGDKT